MHLAQKDILGIRLPHTEAPETFLSFFHIQDGNAKALAAFMVWAVLCEIIKENSDESIFDEDAAVLINSLASINTLLEDPSKSVSDSIITSIARQNQAARVSPVTSYQWACILQQLGEHLTFGQAMERYYQHPEVAMSMKIDGGAESGSNDDAEELAIDQKKKSNIKAFMEKSCREASIILEKHLHCRLWKDACLTERTLANNFIWIGSTAKDTTHAAPSGLETIEPLTDERYTMIDWSLPLPESAHVHLFKRWCTDFEKTTMNIKAASHSKYRKTPDDLLALRNVAALWSQVSGFLKGELSAEDFAGLQADIMTRESADEEFKQLIRAQPKKFALSMLPSYRKFVVEALEHRSQEICNQCEDERNKVREAKWNYFNNAIRRDWERLVSVPLAIREARNLFHDEYVKWIDEETAKGAKAVEWWLERHLRQAFITKPLQATKLFVDFRRSIIARNPGLQESDIYCVVLCDANVPNGKLKEHLRHFAQASSSQLDRGFARQRLRLPPMAAPNVPC